MGADSARSWSWWSRAKWSIERKVRVEARIVGCSLLGGRGQCSLGFLLLLFCNIFCVKG